jgi:hypothetical protein
MSAELLTKRKTNIYLAHFIFLFVQAFIALLLLLLEPSEENNAFFLGYSIEKLLFLILLFGLIIAVITLLIRFRSSSQLYKIDHFLNQRLRRGIKNWIITFCLVFILAGIYWLTVLSWESIFVVAPPRQGIDIPIHINHMGVSFDRIEFHLQRFLPIIYFVIGLGIQTIIFLAGIHSDWHNWKKRISRNGFYPIFWVYGFFLILWGGLSWGSTQLEPDHNGYSWHAVGAPILDRDVLLVFVIGIVLIGIGAAGKELNLGSKFLANTKSAKRDRNVDLVIGLLIWLIAAGFWLSLPTEANWFTYEPRLPNYEFYPNSDALKYDITGQNLILGSKMLFSGFVMHKPLYSAFLALLHTIAGPDFEKISLIQSAIFAVFPALVFLLTKRLHSRLAGIITALLMIFREVNSIELTSRITVSHSRLLMTETPAVIGIILIIWMVFVWIEEPHKKILQTVFIGGVIGVLIQIRNEMLFLLPVILLFTFLMYYRFPKYWLKSSALLVAGVFLFVLPWQIRILHFTGSPVWMTRRADAILTRFQNEPAVSPELQQESFTPETESRAGPLQYIPSHFIHNQKQAFLIFPGAYRFIDSLIGYAFHGNSLRLWNQCCSAENYLDRLYDFWSWQKWDGSVHRESMAAILITLFFISVGIVKSRDKLGALALFPLLIVFAFYLLLSGFRMSGGRRVQVVDWIWIMYFSIGLSQLAIWVFQFLFSAKVPTWLIGTQKGSNDYFSARQTLTSPNNPPLRWKSIFSVGLVTLIFGAMVPIIEQIIPPRYTEETLQAQINTVLMLDTSEILSEFLDNGGVAQQGKALYPRYYAAGESEENDDIIRQFGNLRFYLAGPISQEIVLPLTDIHQLEFPNYRDVLVIGCEDEYLAPLAIYVEGENSILFRDPLPEELVCPLSNPSGENN